MNGTNNYGIAPDTSKTNHRRQRICRSQHYRRLFMGFQIAYVRQLLRVQRPCEQPTCGFSAATLLCFHSGRDPFRMPNALLPRRQGRYIPPLPHNQQTGISNCRVLTTVVFVVVEFPLSPRLRRHLLWTSLEL